MGYKGKRGDEDGKNTLCHFYLYGVNDNFTRKVIFKKKEKKGKKWMRDGKKEDKMQ